MAIDLHFHSFYSDGAFSPSQLIKKASLANLKAVSLTDHDSVSGVDEMMREGESKDIIVLPGIEFSVDHLGEDLHILGFGIDHKHHLLTKFLKKRKKFNLARIKKIVNILKDLGFFISLDDIQGSKDKNFKRVHAVLTLLKKNKNKPLLEKMFGKNYTIDQLWEGLVDRGAPAFVEGQDASSEEVISLIQKIGGVSVWAHPGYSKTEEEGVFDFDKVLTELIQLGLRGLEAYYLRFTKSQKNFFLNVAHEKNLLVTGGSDFHGGGIHPEVELGKGKEISHVPDKIYDNLIKEFYKVNKK